jgi:hypothetical protein
MNSMKDKEGDIKHLSSQNAKNFNLNKQILEDQKNISTASQS